MFEKLFGLSDLEFLAFFLAFLRIVALITVVPVFGSRAVPTQVKIFLSLLLTITILPVIKTQVLPTDLGFASLFLFAMREVFVGLFLGFTTKFIFEGFQFAGRLIGNQMGLGVAELIDPESGAQASPIGNFFSLIAIVLFLQLDGHHFIISAMQDSFRILAINSEPFLTGTATQKMLTMFSEIFVIAIKLAAPAMVAFAILEISMGIIARITPQMNIFFVGLPVRLGVGLIILTVSLPVFYLFLQSTINVWKTDFQGLLLIF